MDKTRSYRLFFGLLLVAACIGQDARADYWEFSTGFNYSKSTYSGDSYTWNRRLGASLGYNFSDSSTIEVAYQKSFERDHYEGFEDSFYDDQVYSVNLVWNILGRNARIQPYAKVGIGQLNRDAEVYDSSGRSQIQHLDQVTGVLGAGLKLYLTKTFAIRMEGTSYLSGGKISTWEDNFGATFGVSLYY
jgi:hypothetical protein